MTSEKDMKKIEIRTQKIKDLKLKIAERINKVGDFELMIGDIQDMITKTNVKLFNKDLIEIANIFYNKGKQSIERLDLSDKLYAEIDHTNNSLIESSDSTVGLFYKWMNTNAING